MEHTQDDFRASGVVIAAVAVVTANTTLNQFDIMRCNDGGNIALRTPGNTTTVVFTSLDAGEWLQVNTDYIMTTSTTSSDILGCTLGRTNSNYA